MTRLAAVRAARRGGALGRATIPGFAGPRAICLRLAHGITGTRSRSPPAFPEESRGLRIGGQSPRSFAEGHAIANRSTHICVEFGRNPSRPWDAGARIALISWGLRLSPERSHSRIVP